MTMAAMATTETMEATRVNPKLPKSLLFPYRLENLYYESEKNDMDFLIENESAKTKSRCANLMSCKPIGLVPF